MPVGLAAWYAVAALGPARGSELLAGVDGFLAQRQAQHHRRWGP